MSKFKFSMQSMLKLREAEEKQSKIELAAATAEVTRLEANLAGVVARLEKETAAFEEKQRRGISAGDYRSACDYFDSLHELIERIREEIAKAVELQRQKQYELQEIYKDKKTLERLREEQYREFLKEEGVKEAKSLEDILMPTIVGTVSADIA